MENGKWALAKSIAGDKAVNRLGFARLPACPVIMTSHGSARQASFILNF
jgi:hypothetical protein